MTASLAPAALSRVAERAAKQSSRRACENQVREQAVRFAEALAPSCRRAARCLDMSPRTLADWNRRKTRGELLPQLRGRPCREVSRAERVIVHTLLDETGPRLGVPALQDCCPDIPRCVLTYLLDGYRRQFQAEHRLVVETLHWTQPGAVWAIDHTQPPRDVDGQYPQILAVRDLASGQQLAWTAVRNAGTTEVLAVLEQLVLEHGPPLVLKSDNGSAFISEQFVQWVDRWQIVHLFSPVRMPRYNGACEAGIGGMKRRTEFLAARQDRFGDWTNDDLFAALLWANNYHYPHGLSAGTSASRFATRRPLGATERDFFRAAIVKSEVEYYAAACTPDGGLTDTLFAACHRRAVRHVLVEHGYLSITRRSIPQPIHSAKCARIK